MRGFRLLGMVLWLSYASLSQAATGFSVQSFSCSGAQATISGDVTGPLSIGCNGSLSLTGGSVYSDTSIRLAADEALTLVDLILSAPQVDLSGASIFIGNSVNMDLRPTAPVGGVRPTLGGINLLADISAGGQITLHGGGGIVGGNVGSTGIGGSISLQQGDITIGGGSGNASITVIPSIPEPSTFAIMFCGLAALASRIRSVRPRRL